MGHYLLGLTPTVAAQLTALMLTIWLPISKAARRCFTAPIAPRNNKSNCCKQLRANNDIYSVCELFACNFRTFLSLDIVLLHINLY
jgi:hypothetical protein